MLRKFALVASLVLAGLVQASPAPADDSHCIFVTESGGTVNLGALCGGSSAPSPSPAPASRPQSTSPSRTTAEPGYAFPQTFQDAGFYLWQSGRFNNYAFDVWAKRGGGGFYYFLWGQPYPSDRSNPDVVVFFDSNTLFVRSEVVRACYEGYGSSCGPTETRLPAHTRYQGPCAFPWQQDSVGRQCGGRAAMLRPGGAF